MTNAIQIDSSLSVNEILLHFPASLSVLAAHGIDTCCGGGLPLARAAADVGSDPAQVAREIANAVASRAAGER